MSNEQDPMRTYAEAKKRVDVLEQQLAEYGQFFGILASALRQRPVEMMLSNTHGIEWGAPAEIALNPRVPGVDYSRWPPKEDIATKLKEYYEAQQDLRNAESGLSPSDRSIVGIGGQR